MVTEAGNVHIFGSITYDVKFQQQVSANDCDNEGQSNIARLAPKQVYFHFQVRSLSKSLGQI